jgi:imidazolonepropionase-like amidohydrolase
MTSVINLELNKMTKRLFSGLWIVLVAITGFAQTTEFSALVKKYITAGSRNIAITHVRVIDGTGAPARPDQTIVIIDGKISQVGPSAQVTLPPEAQQIDGTGRSVIPGLVGMHDHLFYPSATVPGLENEFPNGSLFIEAAYTFPRLYLASGVTTIRTAGSVEPYTDLRLKTLIDTGKIPGPAIFLTAPYLEGPKSSMVQIRTLSTAEETRQMVSYWADQGFTSFKAFTNLSRAQLKAAIEEAHRRHLTVTGHLCSIGFREAIDLGIDNLEHGLISDTEFAKDKKPDACPAGGALDYMAKELNVTDKPVQDLIQLLVEKHIPITSTLALFESGIPSRPLADSIRSRAAMTQANWSAFLTHREFMPVYFDKEDDSSRIFKKEIEFERAFAKAGGLLMAGCDPEVFGGVLAGFGDQREIELLVEAGFTPEEAIQIGTLNGAKFLKIDDRTGSIAPGKDADLILLQGDPSSKISDIRQVVTVFKKGVGYDSAALIKSVQGLVGIQ